jgi:hypothetical protein
MYRALTFPLRAVRRLALALKLHVKLGYSWHLAWVKAAR